jgi:hypothetical protein
MLVHCTLSIEILYAYLINNIQISLLKTLNTTAKQSIYSAPAKINGREPAATFADASAGAIEAGEVSRLKSGAASPEEICLPSAVRSTPSG